MNAIWQAKVWSPEGTDCGTHYFEKLVDAFASVKETWGVQVRELRMAQEDIYCWEYIASPGNSGRHLAVEITKLDLDFKVHNQPIRF